MEPQVEARQSKVTARWTFLSLHLYLRLQQRHIESRLVILYKVMRGMIPAINADEFLIPLRNKRNIKPRLCSDFQTTNFVQRYSVNHTECFKIPESKSDQFKNSFFVRTVSDWNQLEECHIRAETVNGFRKKKFLTFHSAHTAVVDARIGFYRHYHTDTDVIIQDIKTHKQTKRLQNIQATSTRLQHIHSNYSKYSFQMQHQIIWF